MKILTISGSIRANSSNTALLKSLAQLGRERAEINSLDMLRSLPHFDPNQSDASLPEEVVSFRATVANADVVYFSTPEYIHAMPAILKNCLEWLVGDPRFYLKKVVILRTGVHGDFAHESLREVLATMSTRLIVSASMVIPLPSTNLSTEEMVSDPIISEMLLRSLKAVEYYANPKQNKAEELTPNPPSDQI